MSLNQSDSLKKNGKSRTIAVLLSVLGQPFGITAGIGQIYNGQLGLGVAISVIQTINAFLMFFLIGLITYPIVAIIAVYHTYSAYNVDKSVSPELNKRIKKTKKIAENQSSDDVNKIDDSDDASKSSEEASAPTNEKDITTKIEGLSKDEVEKQMPYDSDNSSFELKDETYEINNTNKEHIANTDDIDAVEKNEAKELEELFLKNYDWLDDISITLTGSKAGFNCHVDVYDKFVDSKDVCLKVINILNGINTENLPSDTTIEFSGTETDVRISVAVGDEILSQMISEGGITKELLSNVAFPILQRTVVRGGGADELYKKWIMQNEDFSDVSIDDRHVTLTVEHTYFNETQAEVLEQITNKLGASLFMTVSFVGKNAVYDSATFRSVTKDGETLATMELTADLAEQVRSGEIAESEIGYRLAETIETNVPEPETHEAARDQLISVCRQRTPDYLVVNTVVPAGDTLEITFQIKNPSKRISEEGSIIPKTSVSSDEITEIVTSDIIDYIEATLVGYTDKLKIDRIAFLMCIGDNQPSFKFHIETEWVDGYHNDELDVDELGEWVFNTLESL